MGTPILKIRRSHDRLIFSMVIPIPTRRQLYIETILRYQGCRKFAQHYRAWLLRDGTFVYWFCSVYGRVSMAMNIYLLDDFIRKILKHRGVNKMRDFWWTTFHLHFDEWMLLYFHSDFSEVCCWGPNGNKRSFVTNALEFDVFATEPSMHELSGLNNWISNFPLTQWHYKLSSVNL